MVAYSGGGDGSDWCGMSNRVWGSHVYYTTVATYSAQNPARNHTLPLDRPIALTKCARVIIPPPPPPAFISNLPIPRRAFPSALSAAAALFARLLSRHCSTQRRLPSGTQTEICTQGWCSTSTRRKCASAARRSAMMSSRRPNARGVSCHA
jgi:hypothetical protein